MKEDVTELKRMADVMASSEDYDRERVKTKLSKMVAKYTKFTSAYEQRTNLVSRAVSMYTGLEKVHKLVKPQN